MNASAGRHRRLILLHAAAAIDMHSGAGQHSRDGVWDVVLQATARQKQRKWSALTLTANTVMRRSKQSMQILHAACWRLQSDVRSAACTSFLSVCLLLLLFNRYYLQHLPTAGYDKPTHYISSNHTY
jgi:hypothetical protein